MIRWQINFIYSLAFKFFDDLIHFIVSPCDSSWSSISLHDHDHLRMEKGLKKFQKMATTNLIVQLNHFFQFQIQSEYKYVYMGCGSRKSSSAGEEVRLTNSHSIDETKWAAKFRIKKKIGCQEVWIPCTLWFLRSSLITTNKTFAFVRNSFYGNWY